MDWYLPAHATKVCVRPVIAICKEYCSAGHQSDSVSLHVELTKLALKCSLSWKPNDLWIFLYLQSVWLLMWLLFCWFCVCVCICFFFQLIKSRNYHLIPQFQNCCRISLIFTHFTKDKTNEKTYFQNTYILLNSSTEEESRMINSVFEAHTVSNF